MCGLVGYLSFDKKNTDDRKQFITQALFSGTLRGPHSTGMFMVPFNKNHENHDSVFTFKRAMAGYDFIQLPRYKYALDNINNYKFVIGHNRYTTVGKINDFNAHPFTYEHITLVHNGHLTGLYDLEVPDYLKIDVDSEVLTRAFAIHGYQKIIPKITGAAALIWYDEKQDTIHLYRNKERPLWFCTVKKEELILIASEQGMLHWLAARNGYEINKDYYVKEDNVITFKDSIKFTGEHIPKELPKPIISWRSNSATVGDQLKQLKVKVGQRVEFSFEEMNFNNHKSRHGDLIGRSLEPPYPTILARGIERSKFNGDKILTGVVETIEWDPKYCIHVVRVIEVKTTDKDDPQYTTILDDIYPKDSTLLYEDEPPFIETPKPGWVTGPENYFITEQQFKEWCKNGCVHCSKNITTEMAVSLKWTGDKQPVCPDCQGIPGVAEYVH